jgi:steroid delta-isomerase-like uncharacterized protein
MTQTTIAETARQIHLLFCENRLEQVLDLATDDVVVDLVPAGQSFKGREGFMQFMHVFKSAFPDIQIQHTRVFASGDCVAVEARWSGTHTGPLVTPAGTVPGTGKRVESARICEIMQFRNGRLVQLTNYQDFGSWLRQLGLA